MRRLIWAISSVGIVGVSAIPFFYAHQRTQVLPTSQIEAMLGNCEYFASIFPDHHDPINCVLETYRNVQAIRNGTHVRDMDMLVSEIGKILESPEQ